MRDYDPTTGRYSQADPLGLVDGASVFNYVMQNPMRFVDPRGEWVIVVPIIEGIAGCFSSVACGAGVIGLVGIGVHEQNRRNTETTSQSSGGSSVEGGRATRPMPFGHGREREALNFPLQPFPEDPGSWYCRMLRAHINVLRATIARRYTDLSPGTASYPGHLRFIRKLETHLAKMEANYKAVCGGQCYGP